MLPPEEDRQKRDEDRLERIRQVIAQCRQQLAAGEEFSEEEFRVEYPELMPELESELKKLRVIEAARRAAGAAKGVPEARVHEPAQTLAVEPPRVGKTHSLPFAPPPEPKPTIRYFGDYELQAVMPRNVIRKLGNSFGP